MGTLHRAYWVYILASQGRTLYVGVTNDLARRVAEHRAGTPGAFTTRYRVTRLVYCEEHPSARDAIAREKALKGWRRERKLALIEAHNPAWADLAAGQ
ncbi:GIY-YIG nuclease family protein [Rubrivirga sp. IMCC43871]|uniref:GIY-YIG nuclease family protein n=1 Tax=Rubrivirga sp. IMCC43871 TaxID=3391575 RepID=UPI0039901F58